MNFKKTWKRANDGFTLVELIVVIAILAILAGIAVPAYSGYIKKANKAADLQLLGAVNTAFAAAALENGDDVNKMNDGAADVVWGGTEGAKTVVGVRPEKYNEAFTRYYAGNTGAFKVINDLRFIGGVFMDPANAQGMVSFSYAGGTLYVSQAQLDMLKGSTFNTADGLGVDNLMDQVDLLGSLASGFGSAALGNVLGSEDAIRAMIAATGGDATVGAENLQTELQNSVTSMLDTEVRAQLVASGMSAEDIDPNSDEYKNTFNTLNGELTKNLTIMYAAQSASGQSVDDVMAVINSDSPKADLITSMTTGGNGAQGLGNAALLYSSFTAYAHATGDADALTAANNTTSPIAVFELLENDADVREKFQDYMNNNEQGKADLNAALAAMDVVNGSTTDESARNDILLNGFNNTELVGILENLMK